MNNKNKQGGYEYEDFQSQPFKEPGLLESLINFIMGGGVTTSEMRGAHGEIDKLIENADPNAKIARLARISQGRNIEDLYRVLNPDSTIKLTSAGADRYYDDDMYGNLSNATYTRVAKSLKDDPESKGYDKNLAAYLLAAARNNPYQP